MAYDDSMFPVEDRDSDTDSIDNIQVFPKKPKGYTTPKGVYIEEDEFDNNDEWDIGGEG